MPLVIFLLLPLVELALLIQLGQAWGVSGVLIEIVVSGFIGVWFMRNAGLATLLQSQQMFARGYFPEQTLLRGLLAALGGWLLFMPGVLTDVIGLLLVLPFGQGWLGAWLLRRMQQRRPQGAYPAGRAESQRSANAGWRVAPARLKTTFFFRLPLKCAGLAPPIKHRKVLSRFWQAYFVMRSACHDRRQAGI